jgi:hypothetical protein
MSYAATAQDETEDRYYTQVEAGDVRLFTLDQLDAAFNAGLIHENTYVCLEGESTWLTLAEVAGLGDEEPEAAPVSGPAPVPYQGVAASRTVVPTSFSSPYYVPPSIAPVVNDLALDDDEIDAMSMRPKRRMGKVMAGLAVLALGGLGFAVVQSGGLRGVKLPMGLDKAMGQSAAASMSLPKQTSTPAIKEIPRAPAEAPKPEPVKAEEPKVADATASSSEKADTADAKAKAQDRFSEEMKEALLNKDKKQASKLKSKKAARGAVASKRTASKAKSGGGSSGFKAGGSAYDPLNAGL